ncbi:unnamed protein product [Schistosoma turkestanicum]|nr:unnamed protein product [Schistosoma turkestanicum]
MSNFLHKVFSNYSSSDGRYLDKEGFKLLFIELYGRKPSKEEIKCISSFLESNLNGEPIGLTFSGFLYSIQMLQKRSQNNLHCGDKHDRLLFDCLDLNSKEFITINDLHQICGRYKPSLPSGLLQTIFREFDQDCDGRISYEDYLHITKSDM